jgi:hypothetical protein
MSPGMLHCVYIGQTGRSVDVRLKEYQRHIRLEHLDKSAVAEHSINQGHRFYSIMPPSSTRVPDTSTALLVRRLRLSSTLST